MNGFLNVLKPPLISSNGVLSKLKRISGEKKIGHMGTLDPLAAGVLPVAFGKACRLFDFFEDEKKEYVTVFDFSKSTDTFDAEGKTTGETNRVVAINEIKEIIPSFIGDILQEPPMFSAVHINGKRGYELARQGELFSLPKKSRKIFDIVVLKDCGNNKFLLKIVCSKGTYIRSIVRDMASKMKVFGFMSVLIRTQSNGFFIKDSISIEDLAEKGVEKFLIKNETILAHLNSVEFNDEVCYKKLINGVANKVELENGMYRVYGKDEFFGVGQAVDGFLKICNYLKD